MSTGARRRRWWSALVAAGLLVTPAAATGPAVAQDGGPCTRGDAEKTTQVGIHRFAKTLAGHTRHGVIRSMADCQVQLTRDGAHYTFTHEDVFALQNTYFTPWRCYFDKPRDSVADFELWEVEAWIAPIVDGAVGEATEVTLSTTPVKTVAFTEPIPDWEECFPGPATQVHYQTYSAILDLPPGEYVTTWQDVYGEESFSATVRITVLPG